MSKALKEFKDRHPQLFEQGGVQAPSKLTAYADKMAEARKMYYPHGARNTAKFLNSQVDFSSMDDETYRVILGRCHERAIKDMITIDHAKWNLQKHTVEW
jgi:hypothetical protein